ncbi:MAG: hypothetical protein EZS28_011178 [Streblomastix strix]|uniref:Uncharacterized protein n=1 Tax=Streblomastix strix TaxID=222440 RepID=A0A5J4WEA9_9EUKA|nr:MAG: hypothetical protein EZS28_011178 [Streblomastix strix]
MMRRLHWNNGEKERNAEMDKVKAERQKPSIDSMLKRVTLMRTDEKWNLLGRIIRDVDKEKNKLQIIEQKFDIIAKQQEQNNQQNQIQQGLINNHQKYDKFGVLGWLADIIKQQSIRYKVFNGLTNYMTDALGEYLLMRWDQGRQCKFVCFYLHCRLKKTL